MSMRSLTVFDPEKVFTEVIKPTLSAMWRGKASITLAYWCCQYVRGSCKHIKFFFNKLLCTYLQSPVLVATGLRIPQWIVPLGVFAKKKKKNP